LKKRISSIDDAEVSRIPFRIKKALGEIEGIPENQFHTYKESTEEL